MAICPFCKGTVASANQECSLCGKNPLDHPSIAGGGSTSIGFFDDFDDPSPSIPLSPSPVVTGGGLSAFDEDEEGSEVKLEVDDRATRKPISVAPLVLMGSVARPQTSLVRVDPHEVAIHAGFGPPPAHLWQCPAYAWRALIRKRQLRALTASSKQAAGEAEAARDDVLVMIGEVSRPSLQQTSSWGTISEQLSQVELTIESRQKAFEEGREQFGVQAEVIDRRVGDWQRKQEDGKQKLAHAKGELDAAVVVLQRAQASCKRAEIELRNLADLAESNPSQHSAEHELRGGELNRLLEQRRTELLEPQAVVNRSNASVEELARQLKDIQRQLRATEGERRGLEEAFAHEASLRDEGLKRALSERRALLRALGGLVLQSGTLLVDEEHRKQFETSQQLLNDRLAAVDRNRLAHEAADARSIRNGILVVCGAAGLAVAALILLVW